VSRSQVVTFGVFRVDLDRGELSKFGTPVRLKPQALKLLLLLLEDAGEVVTREEIQKQLWGDNHTFVDFDLGLNHCVRQIRAALGDDATTPRYVETIPRRGYRFIAPVSAVAASKSGVVAIADAPNPAAISAQPAPRHSSRLRNLGLVLIALLIAASFFVVLRKTTGQRISAQSAAPRRIMLAVLPFENLTGDPQQEYLSDGITDELIMHLSRFNPGYLGVIARTSSMRFKGSGKGVDQISRELGVGYVLEGSVKRNGNKVHIASELIQASDQTHLWAESYDTDVTGEQFFAVEEEVASRIARSLSIVLPETRDHRTSTSDPAAYDAYLKGRYYWNRRTEDGFQHAIDYFQQAIAVDPNYAAPYAGLADTYNLAIEYFNLGSTIDLANRAQAAAEKAIELDDDLAEGHAALAFTLWRYQWNPTRADREFREALRVDPNYATAHHWYGLYLASRGEFAQARTELSQAHALDPLSLIIMTNSGWVDYYARDYDASITKYSDAITIAPEFPSALVKMAWAYEQKKMWAEAADTRERYYIATGYPPVASALKEAYGRDGYPGVLNFLLTEAAKPDRRRYYTAYETARMNALLGNKQQAVADLQRAYADRSGWVVFVQQEPAFDSLKSEPAFQQLIAKINR